MKKNIKILLNSRKLIEKNSDSEYKSFKIETIQDLFEGIYLMIDLLHDQFTKKMIENDVFQMIYDKNNKD